MKITQVLTGSISFNRRFVRQVISPRLFGNDKTSPFKPKENDLVDERGKEDEIGKPIWYFSLKRAWEMAQHRL